MKFGFKQKIQTGSRCGLLACHHCLMTASFKALCQVQILLRETVDPPQTSAFPHIRFQFLGFIVSNSLTAKEDTGVSLECLHCLSGW